MAKARTSTPKTIQTDTSLFSSITIYDVSTRCMIQADQNVAALRSLVELTPDKLGENARSGSTPR